MAEPAQSGQPGDSDDILVPLDALEAAWAEVEAVQAEAAGEKPATQAHAGDTANAQRGSGEGSAPADASAPADGSDTPAATSETPAAGSKRGGKRGMRFVVRKKGASDGASKAPSKPDETTPAEGLATQARTGQKQAAAKADAPAARASQSPKPARPAQPPPFIPRVPWWKRLLRALDDLLDVINRPFAGLRPEVRSLIGAVSATTIVVSLTCAWLIPTLMPHRDAITFLEQARATPRGMPHVDRTVVRERPAGQAGR